MPKDDLHYELLRQLTSDPEASQRSLARRLGVSVGKVNYCIRALVDKGWVKANNFRRSDNKWAYAYLLTPTGVTEKIRMTRDFLSRKEREYEALQFQIVELRDELGQPATVPSASVSANESVAQTYLAPKDATKRSDAPLRDNQ